MNRDQVKGAAKALGVVAVVLGACAGAAPVIAQTPVCPAGYYYASDGQCYPGSPPPYPPPVYEYAPPVYQPPVVFDGFALGIGLGGRFGDADRGGGGRRDIGRGDGGARDRGGAGRRGGDVHR
jgi:hypothetical protein